MADLRSIRTQREIQQAMTDLLLKKPFSEITVKEIVAKALINRNTFYLHYKDKYDLTTQMTNSMINQADISIVEFVSQPFKFLQTMLGETSITSQTIMKVQQDDRPFQEIIMQTTLNSIMKKSGSNSKAWFAFGKIFTIITWYKSHNLHYNLVNDAETLQKIYETESFPPLD